MNNLTGRLEKEEAFYKKMEEKLKDMPPILSEYYVSMRANRKSYTTIGVYIGNVLHFARFVTKNNVGDDFYKNVTSSNVESYMISLETRVTKNGIKKTGDDIIQARWSSLNHFFSWLVKREYVDKNPIITVERPKNQTEHKVTYLTKVEINKLYRAVSNNPVKILAHRDRMIISLALATALRVSALVNINIEDIDFDNNIIRVVEKRHKVRGIEIGEQTAIALREWIEIRNEEYQDVESTALFLSLKRGRLSDDAVGHMLSRYCEEAGIKRITPHKLRSTAACMLAKNSIPVKAIAKQLGHNNISTTMKYIDVFEDDMDKARNILDNLT